MLTLPLGARFTPPYGILRHDFEEQARKKAIASKDGRTQNGRQFDACLDMDKGWKENWELFGGFILLKIFALGQDIKGPKTYLIKKNYKIMLRIFIKGLFTKCQFSEQPY